MFPKHPSVDVSYFANSTYLNLLEIITPISCARFCLLECKYAIINNPFAMVEIAISERFVIRFNRLVSQNNNTCHTLTVVVLMV